LGLLSPVVAAPAAADDGEAVEIARLEGAAQIENRGWIGDGAEQDGVDVIVRREQRYAERPGAGQFGFDEGFCFAQRSMNGLCLAASGAFDRAAKLRRFRATRGGATG